MSERQASKKILDAASGPLVRNVVLQIEKVSLEQKNDLQKRRLQNFYAQAKYLGIHMPSLRALLNARKRLKLAREFIAALPPHQRAEIATLAQMLGDTSELFKAEVPSLCDAHLQALR